MRRRPLPVLGSLAALILLVACDTARDDTTLLVDLGYGFAATPVRVEVNDRVVFEGTAEMGEILATAGIIPVDVVEGEHHVRATVEGASVKIAVHTDTTATVRVSYDTEAGDLLIDTYPFPLAHR